MPTPTEAAKAVKLIDGICFFITVLLVFMVSHATLNWGWSLLITVVYFLLFVGSYAISEKRNEGKAKSG